MIRSTAISFVLVAALVGCNDNESIRQDQQREQAELAREQAEERNELAREQAEERAAAAEAARRTLAEQAEDVQEERQDVTEEARRLQETVALACQSVPANVADTCPIDRRQMSSSSEKNDGVEIHLARTAGTEAEFERRVDCYRARASLRAVGAQGGTPAPAGDNVCVFDLDDVNVNITERDNHVVVELTSSVRARVEELKAHTRRLTASLEERARTTARN